MKYEYWRYGHLYAEKKHKEDLLSPVSYTAWRSWINGHGEYQDYYKVCSMASIVVFR